MTEPIPPHAAVFASLRDAIAELVHDGDAVAMEGFSTDERRQLAALLERMRENLEASGEGE